ncbi:hypothetical protein [Caulobacter sp. AP07]|uniref:hypothetical protein n=1 Tax=Caulobacter sp. AP07 TaxID=1144304 RepID=UPI0002F3A0D0|nr:hypothetical protein [Caulobacter sp. AP07]
MTEAKTGYDALMHVVCAEQGFCGCTKHGLPLHVDLFIPPRGPVTADQFVEWVFLADDQNPNSDLARWQGCKDAIRAAFVEHMGGEVVDAERLQWSGSAEPGTRTHGRA